MPTDTRTARRQAREAATDQAAQEFDTGNFAWANSNPQRPRSREAYIAARSSHLLSLAQLDARRGKSPQATTAAKSSSTMSAAEAKDIAAKLGATPDAVMAVAKSKGITIVA